MTDFDVLIVGAGAAGLAALQTLERSGVRAMVLEARDRIGGRVYTVHDSQSPLPVELGAEFIHGRPPELWLLARDAGLAVFDGTDASRYVERGKVKRHADSWDLIGTVLNDMHSAAASGSDQSFDQFLASRSYDEATCRAARGYIEGFNAADACQISIQALAEETAAADAIGGGRVYRFAGGYDAAILHLLASVPDHSSKLRLQTVVEKVSWRRGQVTIDSRHALTGAAQTWTASGAIVTVPLGVLQHGRIRFSPQPTAIIDAAKRLRFGNVYRVVFRFREAFWEARDDLRDAGFLLSSETDFPTWWTTLAMRSHLLVGWHSGARAERMKGMPPETVIQTALSSLARLLQMPRARIDAQLEQAYFHDWQADPFALGAYSYVPVGALEARRQMAVPVDNTLFFAGEATDQAGHSATVHGAIASGRRAARQLLDGGVVADR